MKRTLLIALSLLCCCLSAVWAQEKNVSGVVKDAKTGEPLSGATIAIQGTSTGTMTDLNGNYSLTVDPQSTLVVSYIGYESRTITVNGRSVVNVSLQEDQALLEMAEMEVERNKQYL